MASAEKRVTLVADYIAMRLETDEKFQKLLKADPKKVLLEYGLPEDVVASSMVNNAAALKSACVDLTCWSSACPGTCSVTAISSTRCHCPH